MPPTLIDGLEIYNCVLSRAIGETAGVVRSMSGGFREVTGGDREEQSQRRNNRLFSLLLIA